MHLPGFNEAENTGPHIGESGPEKENVKISTLLKFGSRQAD